MTIWSESAPTCPRLFISNRFCMRCKSSLSLSFFNLMFDELISISLWDALSFTVGKDMSFELTALMIPVSPMYFPSVILTASPCSKYLTTRFFSIWRLSSYPSIFAGLKTTSYPSFSKSTTVPNIDTNSPDTTYIFSPLAISFEEFYLIALFNVSVSISLLSASWYLLNISRNSFLSAYVGLILTVLICFRVNGLNKKPFLM